MTSEEITQRFMQHRSRAESNTAAVVTFARGLVHVLKDHHADATAQELGRLLFAIHAEEQDFQNFVKDNAREIFGYLLSQMGSGPV